MVKLPSSKFECNEACRVSFIYHGDWHLSDHPRHSLLGDILARGWITIITKSRYFPIPILPSPDPSYPLLHVWKTSFGFYTLVWLLILQSRTAYVDSRNSLLSCIWHTSFQVQWQWQTIWGNVFFIPTLWAYVVCHHLNWTRLLK